MLKAAEVSAVIVTRGDVDLWPVLNSLAAFDDVFVWDNSKRHSNAMVYGRYLAVAGAKHNVIYTQDDDCITDPLSIVEQYEPGVIVANVPEDRRAFYSDGVTLIGWGSVFDKSLTAVFHRYLAKFPYDELFLRECDRVFTGLNKVKTIEVPLRHLEHAHGADRMGREKRHLSDLETIRRRVKTIRGAID